MSHKPTLLGYVGSVTGGAISVRLSPNVSSGIAIIGGTSYRIGQVGSFIRVPQGYHDLYGLVVDVGASAVPSIRSQIPSSTVPLNGERWMTVQLVGEIVGLSFERGISQYPNVGDEVHLVTEQDLRVIYGTVDKGQVVIGRLANAEGISVRIDVDKLVTRHSAVLGSTGSGKSTTVASLLRSIVSGDSSQGETGFGAANILLIDIHGEYGRALKSVSKVFKVSPSGDESPLRIPFWALQPSDLFAFLMGRLDDKPLSQIFDKIFEQKMAIAADTNFPGLDPASMTVDSPVPFSLKKLWRDLIEPEVKTWEDPARTRPALIDSGDADTLRIPKYHPHSTGNTAPFINTVGVLGIRRQLDQMRSRLLDRKYDFLLHPGEWEPDLNGKCSSDLPDLLGSWLGHGKPITILDLSGVPSTVLAQLVSAILKILYEGLFWGRRKSEGGIYRPMLVVMEEAHRYLSKEAGGPAREIVQRIVKEGRKFGIGAMIVSQRPAEVDETILSQCGTFFALRLSNPSDRAAIQGSLPDSLYGIVESLPVLRTGEAIITGEAAKLPLRCRITLPAEEFRPQSEDPEVSLQWGQGQINSDYSRLVAAWRAQNPMWVKARITQVGLSKEEINAMERESVSSSTIVSIGYDVDSETLEVEFKSGGMYQYYNVPKPIYDEFMGSGSKGQFLHYNIKNAYPYSKV